MSDTYKPVVFEDSQGNIISNDPRYLAMKYLKDNNLNTDGSPINPSNPKAATNDDEDTLNDDDGDTPNDYKGVTGKALVALAKERGVEFNGRKAGEVRADLIKQDTDAAAQAEVDKANSGSGTEDENK